MRLSDILKRLNGQTAAPSPAPETPRFKIPTAPVTQDIPASRPPSPSDNPVPSAEDVYSTAILEIREILSSVDKGHPFSKPIQSAERLIAPLKDQSDEILYFAARATPDVYLYAHSVNVAILSMLTGQAIGMKGDALADLGLCALLHDLGMIKHLKSALKSEKLSPAEHAQIRKHSQQGQELLSLITGLPEHTVSFIKEIIVQVHERKNGAGYPHSLKGEEIHQFARIIAIADVFEATTHPRSYRDRSLPHDALKSMVHSAETDFDSDLLKVFIEQLSLYPVGSYVRLNTEQIARVVAVNRGLPTRPRIKIIISENLARIPEPKPVDLSSTPLLFVREAVDETRLNLPDKKLALELKAVRWWVKGL